MKRIILTILVIVPLFAGAQTGLIRHKGGVISFQTGLIASELPLNYISLFKSINDSTWIDLKSGYNARLSNSYSMYSNDKTINYGFLEHNYIFTETTEWVINGRFTSLSGNQFQGNFGSPNSFLFGSISSGGNFRIGWADALITGSLGILPDTLYHEFKLNNTGFYVDDVLAIAIPEVHTSITNTTKSLSLFAASGISNATSEFELIEAKVYDLDTLRSAYFGSQNTKGYDDLIVDYVTGDIVSVDSIFTSIQDTFHININNGFDLWFNSIDSIYSYIPYNADTNVLTSGDTYTNHIWVDSFPQNGTTFLPCETEIKLPIVSELYNTDTSHFWYSATKDTAYSIGFEEIRAQIDLTYSNNDGLNITNLSILQDSVTSSRFNSETFSLYCLGNSITNGVGTTPNTTYPNSYPWKLVESLVLDGHDTTAFIKNGRNGYTTESMHNYLDAATLTHYDIVTIMLGVNDSYLYKDDDGLSITETGDKYFAYMDSCIQLINSKLTPNQIIFITPTTPNWGNINLPGSSLDDTDEPWYNEVVSRSLEYAEVNKFNNIYLVKGHEVFNVGDNSKWVDGLHLSNEGALELAKYIRDYTTLYIGNY